ncbi:unnamed protein product [Ilex paraguariensis]|uniref:Uncharacterized protein n=1 Tax=Ilex paraguariensis TaxID=185542 RepID=A0ABC8SWB9_9AQUA
MEATSQTEGLLEKIRPPRLEDAGLEDCALPPESIKEAFFKAATAVKSHAASIFSASGDEPEDSCLNDPWPTFGESSDKLVGVIPGTEPSGSCVSEKGGGVPGVVGAGLADTEKMVEPEVPEGGEAWGDGLQGLEIGEKGQYEKGEKQRDGIDVDEEDNKDGERPKLTEGYV